MNSFCCFFPIKRWDLPQEIIIMQYLFLTIIIMNWRTGSQLSMTVVHWAQAPPLLAFTCTSPVSLKAPYISNTGSQTWLRSRHIMKTSNCLLSKLHCSPSWKPLFPYIPTSIWSCSWQHWFQKKCCYWADKNFWHLSWFWLGWIELIFFLVAGIVLCFGFRMRIMLITYWCFSCC